MNSVSSSPVSENLLCTGIQFVMSITVMPHPFRVVGRGGGGDPSSMPFKKGICLIWELFLYFRRFV